MFQAMSVGLQQPFIAQVLALYPHIGRELAVPGLQRMLVGYRFAQRLWRKPTLRLIVATVFSAFLGVAASRMFIGSVAVVEGKSMMPSYPPGTHLYATPISTRLERGDVVLLDDGSDEYAVKRIIGLPGETVQLWRGCVFVNRKLLVEPYLPPHTYTFPSQRDRRGDSFVLGESEYFVLGDNRLYSADSRSFGPLQRKQIKKRVPLPDSFVCAYFGTYTLPEPGKTVIRPLNEHGLRPNPF
jgi:signal peptidase I